MIRIENLWKTYHLNGRSKTVARGISLTVPPRVGVAILGRNGAGKSTLMRMIAGTQDYDSGRIIRHGTISPPVGFSGSFVGDMTGRQNTRFVARISGVDTDELVDYVSDFAELGVHFDLPVRTYSSGMRSRLAFGISMGIQYDTYLCDEVTAAGDQTFQEKSTAVFRERIGQSGLLFITHSIPLAKDICTHGAVLEDGVLHYFHDVEDACRMHLDNARRAKALAEEGRAAAR